MITDNFEEAKRYYFKILRRRELTQGKNNHEVGATKNNIGLMFNLMGDHEQALKYHTEGEKVASFLLFMNHLCFSAISFLFLFLQQFACLFSLIMLVKTHQVA